ncbi:MAG: hypothetical protein N4A72_08875 [Bacteroidales bacterium]|jgi:hypothetical protein|nr:hypothetical protein [Bacteroidales bacterium]
MTEYNFFTLRKFTLGSTDEIEKFFADDNFVKHRFNGVTLINSELNIKFRDGVCNNTDYPIGATVLPIVSEKLRLIIADIEDSDNIEFIPVKSDKQDSRYYLLNLLNNIPCFDFENSEYTTYINNNNIKMVETVDRLKMNTELIGNRNIFRIKEIPAHIFVTTKFKDTLEQNNITGVEFNSINKFEIW